MPAESKKERPERVLTDESLRTEREKTDQALADNQSATEEDTDDVIRRAREKADAVLEAARERADEQLEHAAAQVGTLAAVARERALADGVLRNTRASQDEGLRIQREEHAKILARLLPLERETTDRYLLTERVRADDALAHRDDFLNIVSHDLRNLLSGIVLSTSLMSDGPGAADAGASTRFFAERIQRYAARMNRLIGDLVDVGSIDAGSLAVVRLRGDLSGSVTEALETFRAAASAKGLSLEIEQLDQPLLADFDHDRILQVLANLIANAVKFSERGPIRMRGEVIDDAVLFTIRDNGSGIPESMLESVFERFWQVGKNDRRGMGLGLYISRCIIEAHDGTIWAESTPGQGSQFCFRIPAARP